MNSNLDLLNTKEKIIGAAIDLFSLQGYTETTMRQIATQTGIRGSSIYNHFSSKYEILQEILCRYSSMLKSGVSRKIPVEVDKSVLTPQDISKILFFSFPPKDRELYQKIQKIIYFEQVRNPEIRRFFQEEIINSSYPYIKAALSSLAAQGLLPPFEADKMSSALYAVSMGYSILSTMDQVQLETDNENTQMFQVIQYLLQFLLDGNGKDGRHDFT